MIRKIAPSTNWDMLYIFSFSFTILNYPPLQKIILSFFLSFSRTVGQHLGSCASWSNQSCLHISQMNHPLRRPVVYIFALFNVIYVLITLVTSDICCAVLYIPVMVVCSNSLHLISSAVQSKLYSDSRSSCLQFFWGGGWLEAYLKFFI